jgi:hypothetical protein
MKKKQFKLFLISGLIILLSSFTLNFTLKEDSSLARANVHRGVYIFMDSEPKQEYEVLGNISKVLSLSGSLKEYRNGIIKKAQKKFSDAEGVILNEKAIGGLEATVIKFKESKDKSKALVNTYLGLKIFMDNEPITDYDVLGSVNKVMGWTGSLSEYRNGIVKKSKKKYPDADGVILSEKAIGGLQATVIKFQNN